MKIKISLLFFIIIANSLFSQDINNTLYVNASKGLNLRMEPKPNGKVLTIIPNGEKVLVVEVKNEKITINNISGSWVKIKWNNLNGWVFNGFLSTTENDSSSLIQHIKDVAPKMSSDVAIIKADTAKVVDLYKGYYTVTYVTDFPGSRMDPSLDTFSVWIKQNNSWAKLYSRDTWGFIKLLVRDINNDSIPDLICWEGGCCSSAAMIKIYLGKKDFTFEKNAVKRNKADSDYLNESEYKDEDFIYDGVCGNNKILGATIDQQTDKETKYIYIFDCESNTLVKK
jgi:uncharacterized protein YraI